IKVNLFMAQEKMDDAGKVLDAIIAINPESELGASAAKFKPRFEEMKKAAAAQKEEATTEEATEKPAEKTE
ncbi:hypothetical protein N9A86_04575, partial [Akkermansiaceae bacterium]|nr:hypothetical protein [Akkermansiaceae bacterium]